MGDEDDVLAVDDDGLGAGPSTRPGRSAAGSGERRERDDREGGLGDRRPAPVAAGRISQRRGWGSGSGGAGDQMISVRAVCFT